MSTDKRVFHLSYTQARRAAADAVLTAPDGYFVTVQESNRTLEQNAAQFPYLAGFSEQLLWPVNGEMVKLDALEWKDILTCAFEGEVNPRVAMGFSGGVVMLGRRTSKYGKKQFSEWYEWLMAAAAFKGVTPVYKSERIVEMA